MRFKLKDRYFYLLIGLVAVCTIITACSLVSVGTRSGADMHESISATERKMLSRVISGDTYSNDLVDSGLLTPKPLRPLPPLPKLQNAEVRKFVRHYTSTRRRFLVESLARRRRYDRVLNDVFRYHGVPEDLTYLALVESGYKPDARSRSGAVGMWQFIKSTGRLYGLKVSVFRDERKNVLRSTVAAAKYLRDLYEMFDDWGLAIGAYNGGPGRVRRAMRRTGSSDFFVIARKGGLRRETREFVPKVLAVVEISEDPSRFGIKRLS